MDQSLNNAPAAADAAAIRQLRESEECFRKSCEEAPIGMALVALDGRWIKVNRAVCDIVGYSETELLASDFQSITHPADLDADLMLLNQLLAGEIRQYQLFKRYLHRSGRHVWIQLNVSLVRDATNAPLYFISQIQDITEQKRMEDALRLSEQAYRTMFDLAGAGMANVDLAEGRFLNVNQKLCALLGYTAEELLRMTVHEITHVDDRNASEQRVRSLLENGVRASAYQKRYVRKDGQTIWVAINASAVVDASGTAKHAVAMVRDITDQKLAEESMRLREQRFRALADHAPVAIFEADVQGNNRYANARWCQMTGLSADEAHGMGWIRSLHPDDRERVFENRRAAILAGQEYEGQYRYIRPDGSVVWVNGIASPLRDERGQITGYLGTATDQTHRRKTEQLETDRREVLELVARDQSLDVILRRTVSLLQRQLETGFGAVYLMDEDSVTLQSHRMPGDLAERLGECKQVFVNALQAGFDPGQVRLTDLRSDTACLSMRPAIEAAGLHSAWTLAIASKDAKPLGFLSFYNRHDRAPTSEETGLLQMVSQLLSISIEHHQTTRKLAHLIRHDGLTGMPNRLMLDDRAQHAVDLANRSGRSVAMMVLDVDKFKSVNDTFGHAAGDELLKHFAVRLSGLLRSTDTIARVGGDEFVIVLPEVASAEAVAIVAQKLVNAAREPFEIGDAISLKLSASIGIALYPQDAPDREHLQVLADQALYRVKENGRDRFAFYQAEVVRAVDCLASSA